MHGNIDKINDYTIHVHAERTYARITVSAGENYSGNNLCRRRVARYTAQAAVCGGRMINKRKKIAGSVKSGGAR